MPIDLLEVTRETVDSCTRSARNRGTALDVQADRTGPPARLAERRPGALAGAVQVDPHRQVEVALTVAADHRREVEHRHRPVAVLQRARAWQASVRQHEFAVALLRSQSDLASQRFSGRVEADFFVGGLAM